jgi:hypothetical protein
MGVLEGFLYGLLGGALAEVLGLFRLRQQAAGNLPEFLKSTFYWMVTVAMLCAGGGIVVVYFKSGISLNPLLAVNVGASAPLIISSLVAQTPNISPGKVD